MATNWGSTVLNCVGGEIFFSTTTTILNELKHSITKNSNTFAFDR